MIFINFKNLVTLIKREDNLKLTLTSIINYPTVCLCVGLYVTELLPNEGSNLNK